MTLTTAEWYALTVWLVLVGTLAFLWAEREMRYMGEAVNKVAEIVASAAMFVLALGIMAGVHAVHVAEARCGADGLGQVCYHTPGPLEDTDNGKA